MLTGGFEKQLARIFGGRKHKGHKESLTYRLNLHDYYITVYFRHNTWKANHNVDGCVANTEL